ncbi:hypothetical protein BH11PLA1_BH11PLA1_12620 [soil metagenome]
MNITKSVAVADSLHPVRPVARLHAHAANVPRRLHGLGPAAAFVLLVCAGALSGCSNTANRPRVTPGPNAATSDAPLDVDSPVESSQLRERAIEMLVTAATSGAPEQRVNALEGLLAVPSRLGPVVALAVKDPSVAVRTVGAIVAGRARVPGSAPGIRPLLNDASQYVQAAAIYALTRLGENPDQTPLARMLKDASPRVRSHAAFVIGELGNTSAVPLLRDAQAAPTPGVGAAQARMMRLQLAEAMAKLGDQAAIQEIRAAIYPSSIEDLETAALAAQILGQVRDQPSRGNLIVLTALWNEKHEYYPPEIRLAAASALAKLGNPRGGFIAQEYAASNVAPQRAQAAAVFGETRLRENLGALAPLMRDADPLVRVAAAAGVLKITESQ